MRDRECPGPSSLSTQGCRQVVRQGTLTPSSAGSSPAIPARFLPLRWFGIEYASLAQLAEHLPFKQGVRGSNPRRGTKSLQPLKGRGLFCFAGATLPHKQCLVGTEYGREGIIMTEGFASLSVSEQAEIVSMEQTFAQKFGKQIVLVAYGA